MIACKAILTQLCPTWASRESLCLCSASSCSAFCFLNSCNIVSKDTNGHHGQMILHNVRSTQRDNKRSPTESCARKYPNKPDTLHYVLVSSPCVFVETCWYQLPLIIIPIWQKTSSTIMTTIMRSWNKERICTMSKKWVAVEGISMACPTSKAALLTPVKPRKTFYFLESEPRAA